MATVTFTVLFSIGGGISTKTITMAKSACSFENVRKAIMDAYAECVILQLARIEIWLVGQYERQLDENILASQISLFPHFANVPIKLILDAHLSDNIRIKITMPRQAMTLNLTVTQHISDPDKSFESLQTKVSDLCMIPKDKQYFCVYNDNYEKRFNLTANNYYYQIANHVPYGEAEILLFDERDESKEKNMYEKKESEKQEKIKGSNMCIICMNQDREICFIPCGHVSCCPECSSKLDKCCSCRASIQHKQKIFIS
jgi:Zinc finger, C3HC4 type (RING finger)